MNRKRDKRRPPPSEAYLVGIFKETELNPLAADGKEVHFRIKKGSTLQKLMVAFSQIIGLKHLKRHPETNNFKVCAVIFKLNGLGDFKDLNDHLSHNLN